MRKIKNKFLLTTLLLSVLLLVLSGNNAFAYSAGESQYDTSSVNPLNYLTKQLMPGLKNVNIGTTAPTLPGMSGGLFKGFISGTASQQFKLLNSSNLSFDDITGSLKSIAVLAINLFLIVLQTVAAILKALLPFLG